MASTNEWSLSETSILDFQNDGSSQYVSGITDDAVFGPYTSNPEPPTSSPASRNQVAAPLPTQFQDSSENDMILAPNSALDSITSGIIYGFDSELAKTSDTNAPSTDNATMSILNDALLTPGFKRPDLSSGYEDTHNLSIGPRKRPCYYEATTDSSENFKDLVSTDTRYLTRRVEVENQAVSVFENWLCNYPAIYPRSEHLEALAILTSLPVQTVEQWLGQRLRQSLPALAITSPPQKATSAFHQANCAQQDTTGQHVAAPPAPPAGQDALNEAALLGREKRQSCSITEDFNLLERNPENPYQCTLRCGMQAKTRNAWRKHEEMNYPQEGWLCRSEECHAKPLKSRGMIFYRKQNALKHYEKVHPNLAPVERSSHLANGHFIIASRFPQNCGFCIYRFVNWEDRIAHIAEHFRKSKCMLHWEISTGGEKIYDDKNQNDGDDNPSDDPGTSGSASGGSKSGGCSGPSNSTAGGTNGSGCSGSSNSNSSSSSYRDSSELFTEASDGPSVSPSVLENNCGRRQRTNTPSMSNPISTRAHNSRYSEGITTPCSSFVVDDDSDVVENDDPPPKTFYVSLDYGTSFTSVSYYVTSPQDSDQLVRASDIKTIKNWPDDATGLAEQVPTEIWYSSEPLARTPAYNRFDAPRNKPNTIQIIDTHDIQNGLEEDQDAPIDMGLEVDRDGEVEDSSFDDDQSKDFFWGYSVLHQRYQSNPTRNPKGLVQRPKLMLSNTAYAESDRKQLCRQVNYLVKKGIIRKYGKKSVPDMRDVRDIITDFLIKVFEHTKKQLQMHEGFTNQSPVEFTLTVPASWSPEASRIMQFSMEAAIRESEFGYLMNQSIHNLFMISEPEAAIMWLLQDAQEMMAGETVICLDSGGGTVDAMTYEISTNYPLRLSREVVAPNGDSCGGDYLNEHFKALLLHRLRDETYLEHNERSLSHIVNGLVYQFETFDKRRTDITTRPVVKYFIPGLRGDKAMGLTGPRAKRFDNNTLLMNKEDYREIFLPVLKQVWEVLEKQLETAIKTGRMVKTIFLIGGFSAAPRLIDHLKNSVIEYEHSRDLPYHIRLFEDGKKSVTAVSSGGLLRSLNKNNGPGRHAQSSYGLLRLEPYEPTIWKSHMDYKPARDDIDDESYVAVINYFIVIGAFIPQKFEFGPFRSCHTFPVVDSLPLMCEELLYVSDSATKSHYSVRSNNNKDAQIAGRLIVDMSFVRDEGHIEIYDCQGELVGKPHYRVEYDIFIIVEGRNLRYEARWPASDTTRPEKARSQRSVEIKGIVQVSIAAAFQPGTG